MGIKFKQGIIVVLIVFTTLTLLSCFKKRDTEDPSAPIVNTIRLEDGELLLVLNDICPKNLWGVETLDIIEKEKYLELGGSSECSASFGRYYSKNLLVDEENIKSVGLRTIGLPKQFSFQNNKYFMIIEAHNGYHITITIEVEYKDGEFRVLSEKYDAWHVERRDKHYENTYYEE